MIVEQIWTANAYRNFNYLVACPETGDALAIDPLDHQKCLSVAKDKGWNITQVLNTHEHGDHTGGNKQVIAATGAKLLAHANAKDTIPGIDRGLGAGDVIKVGNTVELESLDTPGHTMSHVCLLSHSDTPALFCGDTLFNAGAGNCHSGGHPAELYQTIAGQLAVLPDNTLIYPGHAYIANDGVVYFSVTSFPRYGRLSGNVIDQLIEGATNACVDWRNASIETRVGCGLEILHRLNQRSFEMAFCVMHTTGQGFMMAFQAGGPHAQDRGRGLGHGGRRTYL